MTLAPFNCIAHSQRATEVTEPIYQGAYWPSFQRILKRILFFSVTSVLSVAGPISRLAPDSLDVFGDRWRRGSLAGRRR